MVHAKWEIQVVFNNGSDGRIKFSRGAENPHPLRWLVPVKSIPCEHEAY
jgi:hypothetical protein